MLNPFNQTRKIKIVFSGPNIELIQLLDTEMGRVCRLLKIDNVITLFSERDLTLWAIIYKVKVCLP